MRDVNQNINPSHLKIGISKMRSSNTGTVTIKCKSKREVDILEREAKNKLGDCYDVQLTQMRKPRVKITNFGQNLTADEIESCILEQNDLPGDFKVTYVKKRKNGLGIIYGECSGDSFNKLIASKRIFIGWESVYEDLSIPRCYQCQGFYHKKQQCKHKLVCPLCSSEHEEKECPKQTKCCNNCVESNKTYKTTHDTSHHTTDQECPTLKYKIMLLRNKTEYCT
ncbi:hypothetical protein JTB14_020069 [Gonioctena quinquepunctata]|nr:hypothetical protein JTB14_020069 [Gonioctena quinquepunctata]